MNALSIAKIVTVIYMQQAPTRVKQPGKTLQ
jgi:hypothetical protein